jgi:hypothetical protein
MRLSMATFSVKEAPNLPSQEKFWADFVKHQEAWEWRQEKLDAKITALADNIGGLNRSTVG